MALCNAFFGAVSAARISVGVGAGVGCLEQLWQLFEGSH
jgi:hypothetical protein